mmetsp:Transcript_34516/g.90829  ORF Transcript_34516/g.90829 Transcript_34516/m.90829 type:complete len:208 (+) Transcript_34516:169-792(+)
MCRAHVSRGCSLILWVWYRARELQCTEVFVTSLDGYISRVRHPRAEARQAHSRYRVGQLTGEPRLANSEGSSPARANHEPSCSSPAPISSASPFTRFASSRPPSSPPSSPPSMDPNVERRLPRLVADMTGLPSEASSARAKLMASALRSESEGSGSTAGMTSSGGVPTTAPSPPHVDVPVTASAPALVAAATSPAPAPAIAPAPTAL